MHGGKEPEWGFSRTSECEILETELVSHAKIIIARRTKLRPLTRGRATCLREAVSVGFVTQGSACLCLVGPAGEVYLRHPVGLPCTCRLAPAGRHAAVLRRCSLTRPLWGRTGSQPGPLWTGFFLHAILLGPCLLKFSGEPGAFILCEPIPIDSQMSHTIPRWPSTWRKASYRQYSPVCHVSWGQAARPPVGLGGWLLLDWGLRSFLLVVG